MLRTADAAGVEAVVAADPVTDWGNPNLVRASKGTVFSVPVASDSTAGTLDWLSGQTIALVATTPDTDVDYTEVDYTRAGRHRRRAPRSTALDGRGPRRGDTPGADPHGGPGQLASTSQRRPPSSSTRRSASAGGAEPSVTGRAVRAWPYPAVKSTPNRVSRWLSCELTTFPTPPSTTG